jgi:hypothetical protein
MAEDSSIDTRLPYRIGYPKLPVLPVCRETPVGNREDYIPNFGSHARRIVELLKSHGVDCWYFELRHRFNYGHEYSQNLPTIVLLANFQPTSKETIYNHGWIQGVKEIRQVLNAANIYNPVELIDSQAYSDALYPSPVLSSDYEVIEESKAIMPNVLQTISKQDWVSVDVLYRDYPHTPQEVPAVLGTPSVIQDPEQPPRYQNQH